MTASPADVVIREADGDDLDQIVAVGRAVLRAQMAAGREPEVVELLIAKFWTQEANIDAIRAGRTLVADLGGEVVGMASYGLAEGSTVVWKVYVLPEHAGRGYGRALIGAVGAKVSFDHTSLYMPVEDGNNSGLRFAESIGFVEERREEQSGMPELIWMRKDLRRGETRTGEPRGGEA